MKNVKSRRTDRISNLPDNVIEIILMHLPTRDVVRLTILSRKWRHVRANLSQFVLDKTLWENVAKEKRSSKTTFMKVLYQLLLGHRGSIRKFVLSYPQLKSCTEIDNLISFLSENRIEDFTLEMWKNCYILPYSIFACQKLRHLRLRLCSIRSSASLGFSCLTSLTLLEVAIRSEALASLILGSPLLRILEIESYSYDIDICIDAPNLRTLEVTGVIKSINFKRVPVLDWLSIVVANSEDDGIVDFIGVGRNIVKFFDCLLTLETLELCFHGVKSFGNEIPKRLPTSLIHLTDFTLYNIDFNDIVELSFTLCLLRSSPILKYILIEFPDFSNSNSDETTTYMEGEDFSDIGLSELSEVTLNYLTGTKPELEFIRLLLAKSSSLKKVQIRPKDNLGDKGFNILKEVIKFRRISQEAEILFDE